MKKLLTFILLAFICTNLKAQIYVEAVQLDNTNTGAYLIISRGGLGAPFIIDVDYGQSNKSSSCRGSRWTCLRYSAALPVALCRRAPLSCSCSPMPNTRCCPA